MATEFNDTLDWAPFIRGSKTMRSGNSFANRWSEQTLAALRSGGVFDSMVDGVTPPATDKLWLDKNFDPAVLKEWDSTGAAWVPVTFARLFGRAIVTPLTVTGGTGNAIVVAQPPAFLANRLYSLTPANTNSGAVTIQVIGVGTFNATYLGGGAVDASEFTPGQTKPLVFQNGRFEVLFATADLTSASADAIAAAAAAAASASSASSSASAASGSATAAATSATNAGNSATAAAGSATTAQTAATNAGNSASAASTSASNASASATTAQTAATNAGNSATAAATSETNANTSATNAANSASAAAGSATTAANILAKSVRVDTGQTFTGAEKSQAAANLGMVLGSLGEGSNPVTSWRGFTELNSWGVAGTAKSNVDGSMRLTASGADPTFSISGQSISGATERYVAIRYRRTVGSPEDPTGDAIYWFTSGHGSSPSFFTRMPAPVLNTWQTIVLDMWNPTAGGTDWKDNTVTGMRFDLSAGIGSTVDIAWISTFSDLPSRGDAQNDGRYARRFPILIDLLDLNCVAGTSGEASNNATKLLAAIAATPSTGYVIRVPGRFYFSSLGALSGKSVTITGYGKEISALIPTQTSGYFIDLQQDDFTDSVRIEKCSIEFETTTLCRAMRIQFPEADGTNNRLQDRCALVDVEIRGVDVGAHGPLSGIDLVNVHRPLVRGVSIAGRQNGGGPSSFQHMEYGWKISATGTAVPADYEFDQCTVIAAAKGIVTSGNVEGILLDKFKAIAVGMGIEIVETTVRPWIELIGCHIAAFTHNLKAYRARRIEVIGGEFYKREESNADTIAFYLEECDEFIINAPKIVNVAGAPATFGNYDGVILVNTNYGQILHPAFAGLRKGVDIQGTSANNTYVKGTWKDQVGTTTPVEYQVSGSGTGNKRRGMEFEAQNRNSAGAVNVTGGSAVLICSTATDTLEVGDLIRIEWAAQMNKDANAGHVRTLIEKGGTATVLFYDTLTQLDDERYCAASQTTRVVGSAMARVTVRGSAQFDLKGFAPANAFTVPQHGGQIRVTRL